VNREVRDYDEMVFLGNISGHLVVLSDIRIFIPEIHLDDFFHVLIQFPESLLQLLRLRPDSPVDEI